MLTAQQIRQQFLDFFASKGHQVVPSAPIVIKNDPTLLFTNAGMNQFKDYFLGNKKAEFTRVADTQKCLRVSGKHNDLEEVGVDTYHHTMFEMLGNWSFGDYFKKEAIEWCWELLTEVYKIPKDRLYVTVFEGDAKENLEKDNEAYEYWKQYVAEDRILMGNKKDNFWEMGDTGPCGSCSEVHVDCRPDAEREAVNGATLVNADHPQVIEIWNNVFMQFNRLKDGSLETLPAQHVDTGMGFERLVRVIQGKTSNYDTDVFTGTIAEVEKITGKKYDYSDSKQAVAFRVLADHIRAIGFTIADGQLPAATGAGYVIRRILRRAVRYYYSYLDFKQPLLHQLMPLLAAQFEHVFPELHKQVDFVSKVVREEEDSFLRTLDKGLKRFDDLRNELIKKAIEGIPPSSMLDKDRNPFVETHAAIEKAKMNIVVPGDIAFELYDTYGFPIDLTNLIATELAWSVDMQGFETELKKQKDRSRAAATFEVDDWLNFSGPEDSSENEEIKKYFEEERERVMNSDLDTAPPVKSKFVGYDVLECKANVVKVRKVKQKGQELFQIVLDTTPFYAESGGQVGDTGELIFQGESIQIIDTKKENDLIIHFAEMIPADMSGGVLAKVDEPRRRSTEKHHSATHLLHAALRNVLGTHVAQKGSLNGESSLRFDFSHFAKMTDEELHKVEAIVNEKIRENVPVVIKSMHKDEAVALGAMALFGEKYGDIVRVVIMDPEYSIELCGGTHVGNTGELGFFKIVHETAVAAGVRRIEAVTGKAAEDYVNGLLHELHHAKGQLKHPKHLSKSIETLLEEQSELRKKLESLEAKQLAVQINEITAEAKQTAIAKDGYTFYGKEIEASSADNLKKIANELRTHFDVVALCANIDGKASVAIAISDRANTEKGLDAGKLIKEKVAPLIKGGGGGQKTLATAGGQDVSKLGEVVMVIEEML